MWNSVLLFGKRKDNEIKLGYVIRFIRFVRNIYTTNWYVFTGWIMLFPLSIIIGDKFILRIFNKKLVTEV